MAFQILIVDDCEAMQEFINRVIEISGLGAGQCLRAANGQEALAMLREKRVDIVITDINMPTMDGEEFVARLREDAALRTIPVLVVSADGSENRVEQMLALGASGYVKKPFTPEALRARIEELLGASRD